MCAALAPDLARLVALHRKVFKAVKQETDDLLGEPPDEIRSYEKQFRQDFRVSPARLSTLSKADLLEAMRAAEVTWIGDYHTFDQAQRTALRLARDAVRPGELWWLGVELVSSEHQSSLDAFQQGRLSEDGFLEAIRYNEAWGFPWRHYRPLFAWARQRGVRIIALNRPKALLGFRERRDLHERDAWAAGVITDLFYDALQKGESPRMIALYGELHVARHHLPKHLTKISRAFLKRRALSSITIHQNNDGLYFKLLGGGKLHGQDGVRLGPKTYCVFSGTPLAKAQSLLSWLETEGGPSAGLIQPNPADGDGASDDDTEPSTDHLAWVRTHSLIICEFFGLPDADWDSFTLRRMEEALHRPAETDWTAELLPKDRTMARWLIRQNQRFYAPSLRLGYLAEPSQNGAAEIAACHLLLGTFKNRDLFETSVEGYFRRVWEAAFSFLGSLLINPRRKCDLPRDHLRRLELLQRGAVALWPMEAESRSLTLQILESADEAARWLKPYGRKAPILWMSATQLGRVLGRRVHDSLLSREMTPADVRELFFDAPRAITVDRFETLYRRMAREARFEAREESKTQTL